MRAQEAAPWSAQASIAFSPMRENDQAPGLAWLRQTALARLPHADGLSAASAFTLHLAATAGELAATIGSAIPTPAGTACVGAFRIGELDCEFECATDGTEEWRTDQGSLPPAIGDRLAALGVAVDGAPRTLDLLPLVAHLTGPSAAGDGFANLLAIGADRCGPVVLHAQSTEHGVRLRGRSGGGLLVPMLLALAATTRESSVGDAVLDAHRLRALTASDNDRKEAARQLPRHGARSLQTLRSLLHGDEADRIIAIDGLVRMGAAQELPRILAAVDPQMPTVQEMAELAVRDLWALAAQPTRDRTLAVLRDRSLDPEMLASVRVQEPNLRWRVMALLGVLLCALNGLWMRERNKTAALATV